ncbi:MAG: Tat pathway signal protein [Steroidobacteraceae bacterium]|nr:Tat pathway signal protein [Steroidobacteraceae bacterium]
MITRRRLMALTTLATAGSLATAAIYSSSAARKEYDEAVRSTWRHSAGNLASARLLQRELVRYATLAPSSHNTQCWKFRLAENSIAILPDLNRRCPVVDPDDHHLFVSLGCATENLIQAALAHGFGATTTLDAEVSHMRVQLEPTETVRSPLFLAIPERQSTRAEYDGKPLANEELHLLERAGTGNGTRVLLLTSREVMERALEYIVQGNSAQLNDPAFVRELKSWIRFGDAEAVHSGDGLFSRTSGNPSVPHWIGSLLFKRFLNAKTENEKYARHVRSSAGIAVFVSDANDRKHWMESGRCFQRFALQATALGIRTAHLNQPVEVAALRPQFSSFLGLGNHRPDLVVRFGRGPEMPRSLRRPVDAVLI